MSTDLEKLAQKHAHDAEIIHGNCCGDVVHIYQDEIAVALLEFGRELIEECASIAETHVGSFRTAKAIRALAAEGDKKS